MTIAIDPLVAGVTLLMAAGLIYLGWWQLRALREQLVSQLQTSYDQMKTIIERSHAALLPSIDDRYESEQMHEANNVVQELLVKAKDECGALTGDTYEQRLRSCFIDYVTKLREARDPKYLTLMRLCDFFEIVGYLCRKEYLSSDDITDLYGMPLRRIYLLLLPHIKDRQKKEGFKVYECFIELANKAKEKYPDYEVRYSV